MSWRTWTGHDLFTDSYYMYNPKRSVPDVNVHEKDYAEVGRIYGPDGKTVRVVKAHSNKKLGYK